MWSKKVIVVVILITMPSSMFNVSSCYFVEEIFKPDLLKSPTDFAKGQQSNNDKKLLEVLQNIEIENIPISSKEQPAINNNIDNYHEYQHSTCQLVRIIHFLDHSGCQPKAISSFACSGSCSSYVQLSSSKFWQHERSCSCCQQTGLQEATFTLDCPSLDPPYKKIKTYAPVDCMCRACTDLGRENLLPQELVEALAGENIKDMKKLY